MPETMIQKLKRKLLGKPGVADGYKASRAHHAARSRREAPEIDLDIDIPIGSSSRHDTPHRHDGPTRHDMPHRHDISDTPSRHDTGGGTGGGESGGSGGGGGGGGDGGGGGGE